MTKKYTVEEVELLDALYLSYFITSNKLHNLETNGLYEGKKVSYKALVILVNNINPILEAIRKQILSIQ